MLRSLIGVAMLPSKSRKIKSLPVQSASPSCRLPWMRMRFAGDAVIEQLADLLDDDGFQFDGVLGQRQNIRRQSFKLFPQLPEIFDGQITHGLKKRALVIRRERLGREMFVLRFRREREVQFGGARAEQPRGFKISADVLQHGGEELPARKFSADRRKPPEPKLLARSTL